MLSNIGPWQLLIILLIVVIIFGGKKLRTLGGDLGSAVKGFKSAMSSEEEEAQKLEQKKNDSSQSSVKTEAKPKDNV